MSGDRVPVVGEVWTSALLSAVRWTVLAVLNDHYVWLQYTDHPNDTPQTVTVAWMNGGLVPPRKVSREILLIRTTKGGVWSGSMHAEPLPGERTIGTVVVYDDNTIEIKYATD